MLDGLRREELDLIVSTKVASDASPEFSEAVADYAQNNPAVAVELIDELADASSSSKQAASCHLWRRVPALGTTRGAMTERLNGLEAAALVVLKAACVANRGGRAATSWSATASPRAAAPRAIRSGRAHARRSGLLRLVGDDLIEVTHGAPMRATCLRRTLVADAQLISDRACKAGGAAAFDEVAVVVIFIGRVGRALYCGRALY